MTLAIQLKNVTKTFRIPLAKQDSLREFFVNFKSSKSFKTLTVLKIITGIYEPNRGKIEVSGKIVPFLELGVGFNPDLSARDNIFLNGVILGMSRKKIFEKFETIVKFAGIAPFINQKLKNFSSGMQVRLGFSIAFQAHGDIYLLDEILAVGDYQFQQKTNRVFKTMKRQGKTG